MSKAASPIFFALIGGVTLAFASVPLLGLTSAIAAPVALLAWFKSHGALWLGLLVWETLVVFGLGVGVGLAAFLTLLWRASPDTRTRTGVATIAALFATTYAIPYLYRYPFASLHGRSVWNAGQALAVALAIGIAVIASRRGVPN